ncbi:MAG: hypothetical protein LBU87_00285 [Lactobacillales bacterium]|jgi:hypothetical protein|nr:hypothetical protein [Lactobacillales bacterium]
MKKTLCIFILLSMAASPVCAQLLLETIASQSIGAASSAKSVASYSAAMKQQAANQIMAYADQVYMLSGQSAAPGTPCATVMPVGIGALKNARCTVSGSTVKIENLDADIAKKIKMIKGNTAQIQGTTLTLDYN